MARKVQVDIQLAEDTYHELYRYHKAYNIGNPTAQQTFDEIVEKAVLEYVNKYGAEV